MRGIDTGNNFVKISLKESGLFSKIMIYIMKNGYEAENKNIYASQEIQATSQSHSILKVNNCKKCTLVHAHLLQQHPQMLMVNGARHSNARRARHIHEGFTRTSIKYRKPCVKRSLSKRPKLDVIKVRKTAKIRKRCNQVPRPTQDTTWQGNKNTINITIKTN